jgi:hypothetical protein
MCSIGALWKTLAESTGSGPAVSWPFLVKHRSTESAARVNADTILVLSASGVSLGTAEYCYAKGKLECALVALSCC